MSAPRTPDIESTATGSMPARAGGNEAMIAVPTILGELHVNDQGNESQPVAMLWPSLFTDHRMWAAQVAALRGEGWRTLALDPPGHGRSPGPGRRFTMDECAEAALQLLDARGVRGPVVVVGTSWGGFVAPRVALRAADRVRGLVLFNTSAERPSFFERQKTTLLTKMFAVGAFDRTVDGMIASSTLCTETRRLHPEIGLELTRQLRSWDRRAANTAIRSVLVDRDSVLDALPAVKVPALVVSGKEDPILPSKHSELIAAKIPTARHVQVPGAAHLVPLEDPRTASTLVLDFLRRLPEKGADPWRG
jgi:3-oxoadipate enol-lactonase